MNLSLLKSIFQWSVAASFWLSIGIAIFLVFHLLFRWQRILPFCVSVALICYAVYHVYILTLIGICFILFIVNVPSAFFWAGFAEGTKKDGEDFEFSFIWAYFGLAPIQLLSLAFGAYLIPSPSDSVPWIPKEIVYNVRSLWWLSLATPPLTVLCLWMWARFTKRIPAP